MASTTRRTSLTAQTNAATASATAACPIPTPSPSTRSGGGDNPAPPPKRRRINFACDYCRLRKTRCDEGQPSCFACLSAGVECVTKNRRQPWLDVRRHEAGKPLNPDKRLKDTGRHHRDDSISSAGGADQLPIVGAVGNDPDTPSSRQRRRLQDHAADTPTHVLGSAGARRSSSLRAEKSHSPIVHQSRVRHGSLSARQPEAAQADDDRPELEARLPIVQIDSGNTPLELMTSWLDLARYRLRIPRLGSKSSARAVEDHANGLEGPNNDSALPRPLGIWNVPEQDALLVLVDRFLDGPNVLFPLLQPERIRQAARTASRHGPSTLAQEHGLPVLMQVYLVMILGHASQPRQEIGFDAGGCLKYSESLLGLILQHSSLAALRAVTLLSMALRCHDKLAAAGHAMSLAVSMGVALGLPRYSPRLPQGEERRSTWTSVFAFEKLLSFELGRSSLIPDDYLELLPGSHSSGSQDDLLAEGNLAEKSQQRQQQPVADVILSLAKLLGDIGRWCVQVSRKEDHQGNDGLAEVVREKVRTTGLSCVKLMEWASDICPSSYRPTSDLLPDSSLHPFTSFIAMQYHSALILVTRNSLLISEKAIRLAVDVIAKNEPWEYAVRNGQNIAVNSARKILRLFVECSDYDAYPALPSLAAPLHAMGVLAVFVVTRPDSRMGAMDRELLKATTLTIKDKQISGRVEKELGFAFNKLEALVTTATEYRDQSGQSSGRGRSPAPPRSSTVREHETYWDVGSSQLRTLGANVSQQTNNRDSLLGNLSEQMSSLDEDGGLEYAEWWPEDNSPMILDEFGWNWANFSQLLDGRGDQAQL